jgi:hypothetical protein
MLNEQTDLADKMRKKAYVDAVTGLMNNDFNEQLTSDRCARNSAQVRSAWYGYADLRRLTNARGVLPATPP